MLENKRSVLGAMLLATAFAIPFGAMAEDLAADDYMPEAGPDVVQSLVSYIDPPAGYKSLSDHIYSYVNIDMAEEEGVQAIYGLQASTPGLIHHAGTVAEIQFEPEEGGFAYFDVDEMEGMPVVCQFGPDFSSEDVAAIKVGDQFGCIGENPELIIDDGWMYYVLIYTPIGAGPAVEVEGAAAEEERDDA